MLWLEEWVSGVGVTADIIIVLDNVQREALSRGGYITRHARAARAARTLCCGWRVGEWGGSLIITADIIIVLDNVQREALSRGGYITRHARAARAARTLCCGWRSG